MKTTAYCRVTAVQKSKGHSATEKIKYIERTGRYKNKPGFVASGNGNLPNGFDNFHQFWQLADQHERANSVTAREFMIDLPDHISMKEAVKLARAYAEKITVCPETDRPLPYSWAVHANEEGHGRHMHLVMSERVIDNIERDPATFFKQQIKKSPKKGGAPKLTNTASTLKQRTDRVKNFIQRATNLTLKNAGLDMTVDFKRTVKQGKRPQVKLTPQQWTMMKSGNYEPGTSKKIDEFIAIDRHNAQVQLMRDDLRLIDLEIRHTERTIEQQKAQAQKQAEERAARAAQEAQAAQRAEQQRIAQQQEELRRQHQKEIEQAALFEQQEAQAIANNERLLKEELERQKQEEQAVQKAQAQPTQTEQERQTANVNAWANRLTGNAKAGMNDYLNAVKKDFDEGKWVDAEDYQRAQEQQEQNQTSRQLGPKL